MKLVVSILVSILTIASCSNTLSNKQSLLKPEFSHNKMNTVYAELIVNGNEPFDNTLSMSGSQNIKIKIVRTSSLNNKHIRQSYHYLKAKLKVGVNYHVSTAIEDDVLTVWLINRTTLEVVSTISTIDTVFEKVFTLKHEIQDSVKRIKVVLNNQQDKIAHLRVITKRKPRYAWD